VAVRFVRRDCTDQPVVMAGGDFEVWRGGREILMAGPCMGPEDNAVDPFYESMDCPMFVDFTMPDTAREEDLQAWFEIYVDREGELGVH
jgi:hypothetical protein